MKYLFSRLEIYTQSSSPPPQKKGGGANTKSKEIKFPFFRFAPAESVSEQR